MSYDLYLRDKGEGREESRLKKIKIRCDSQGGILDKVRMLIGGLKRETSFIWYVKLYGMRCHELINLRLYVRINVANVGNLEVHRNLSIFSLSSLIIVWQEKN